MTFYLERLTALEIIPRNNDLELKVEDFGNNKNLIMKELLDEFGFDLIFGSLCETRLKDLKRELDKRLDDIEKYNEEQEV